MGRSPCCSKVGLRRGPWSTDEDTLLSDYLLRHGEGRWRSVPKNAGLLRCGKSCRLRWMNYLRPGIKRGNIDKDEEDLIVRMHALLGNRWSLIAGRLPGRTDNEIKNYWNTHLLKKLHAPGKKKAENGGEAKVQVCLPKPIRVESSDWRTSLLEMDGDEDEFVGCIRRQDLGYGETYMLDQVYDEYMKLLW